ncbi:helicase-associated domain-containing protein [Planosporangium sp. 12N6]|uniref:helicase-associated domain-containing protein n=1 Tax=Planosporangium spinosum TaxID=3402278 RepID=UPI003CEB8340
MAVTLADHLRALPDPDLAALIALRPDLVVPVPGDISALALRAQSRLSAARALDGLDRFTLEVLDAVRLTRDPETGVTSVEAVLLRTGEGGVEPAAVREALGRLRARSLIYGSDATLHVAAGVDEVCSPYPAGLGRPAIDLDAEAAVLVADAARLRRALLAAPPAARAVLDRLAAGPPVGTVARSALADPDSESPVRWLVDHHLLVPVAPESVELPREVALLLRRETGPLGVLHPTPPDVDAPVREIAAVDRAGAGQAMEIVRHTEALVDVLAAEPAPVLRSGGLGVRELRRLARATGLTEPVAALLLEVAYAAGLLGESGGETGDAVILPAAGFDAWRITSLAQRWARLAGAWLLMHRMPSLVGQRDDRDRILPALSADIERIGAPAQRRAALGVLADLPPGSTPSTEDVRAVLDWRSPRRVGRAAVSAGYDTALDEAATLGLTGLGALTTYARSLLVEVESAEHADPDTDPLGVGPEAPPSAAVEALDALLPAPVDHVLVQADLTIVVPGPPEPGLAAELTLVAEAESPSVYRVTSDSVRRALDIGYAAADLHALFARRSRTPVPQALTYLVDDVSRRHGGLRVGSAGAYLRGDDEAVLAEVLADRRLSVLGLRRLAPTVLISPYAPARLLSALREAGYSPVPEDATGAAVLTRPRSPRAPARPAVPSGRVDDPLAQPRLTPALLAGIVEQLRRGDAATRAARRVPATVRGHGGTAGAAGAQAHTQAMAVLQQALRDKSRVWVGYVDAHGATNSRLVRPVSMGAGYLRAEDERTEMLHTFALHRITAAVPEESTP